MLPGFIPARFDSGNRLVSAILKIYVVGMRKRPNDSPEFNKTLGKALLFTTLGQSLRFTHATR